MIKNLLMSVRGLCRINRINNIAPYSKSTNISQSNPKIYVSNLSRDVKLQDLKDHMKQIGNVISADIPIDLNGRSKGYGILEFVSSNDAQRAIDTLQNSEILGRPIFLREDREKKHIKPILIDKPIVDINALKGKRLYIGNISYDTTSQQLKDFMKPAGDVVRADIISDSSGRSKGCGIVEYNTIQDAKNALLTLNSNLLNGRPVFIREDREDKQIVTQNKPIQSNNDKRHIGKKVFIGNIAFDVTRQELKDHFKQFVSVKHVELFQKNGRSKGSAIVELESSNDAIVAIGKLNDTMVKGGQIFVREDREEGKT